MSSTNFVRRGDVFWVDVPRQADKKVHEGTFITHGKHRPAVVVSSNAGNNTSCAITIAMISSVPKQKSINVDCNIKGRHSQICCNNLFTISRDLLTPNEYICTFDDKTMHEVDVSLCIALGIKVPYKYVGEVNDDESKN